MRARGVVGDLAGGRAAAVHRLGAAPGDRGAAIGEGHSGAASAATAKGPDSVTLRDRPWIRVSRTVPPRCGRWVHADRGGGRPDLDILGWSLPTEMQSQP